MLLKLLKHLTSKWEEEEELQGKSDSQLKGKQTNMQDRGVWPSDIELSIFFLHSPPHPIVCFVFFVFLFRNLKTHLRNSSHCYVYIYRKECSKDFTHFRNLPHTYQVFGICLQCTTIFNLFITYGDQVRSRYVNDTSDIQNSEKNKQLLKSVEIHISSLAMRYTHLKPYLRLLIRVQSPKSIPSPSWTLVSIFRTR